MDLFVADRVSDLQTGDILIAETRIRGLHPAGNPGEMDRRKHSYMNGVYVRGFVRDRQHLLRLRSSGGYDFQRWIRSVRDHLAVFFNKVEDPSARGLLKTCVLGERADLPESAKQAFRDSGLAHLLAISGLHVGLVGLFAYTGLKMLLKRSQWILLNGWAAKGAALGSLPVVLFYVSLAGCPLTGVRAAAMVLLFIGSLVLDRAHAGWNTLGWAALVILLWNPPALFSISFWLSFSAVAALLMAMPLMRFSLPMTGSGWTRRASSLGRKLKMRLGQLFLASAVISLATAPLTAWFFNKVTPLAVLGNLVVIPLVGWFVIPLGLTAGLIALISASAALPFLKIAGFLAYLAVAAAEAFSKIPGSCVQTGDPNVLEMSLYSFTLFLFLTWKDSVWRKRLFTICVIGLVVVFAFGVLKPRWNRHLDIAFLSVGDGDCMVIEFPGGKRMVLDGGTALEGSFDTGRRIAMPFLGRKRICRIDYLAVSHGQVDHYGGLRTLAKHFRPGELWIGPETGMEEPGYKDFLDFCRGRGIRIRRMCRQTKPFILHGTRIEVLHPPCPGEIDFHLDEDAGSRGVNNRSLVIRLVFGSASFLFSGDIENRAEEMLVRQQADLETFLLKVPHHGSLSSSSEAFLERVDPQVAVISAGGGPRFGFPSDRTVQRYGQRNVRLFRTDRDGAVRVRTDGTRVLVRSFRGREETFFLGPDKE